MFRKKIIIMQILLLIFLTIGMVSASDNSTEDIILEDQTYGDETVSGEVKSIENQSSQAPKSVLSTEIETGDVITYYKEKSELVSYIKDTNNQPVCGKKVSVSINDKVYNKVSDNAGKIVLKLNLKPGNCIASIKFEGDENYTSCSSKALIKVKKPSLLISSKNFKSYYNSDKFFKVKITNKVTKNPIQGIKVAFKVWGANSKKYKIYYAKTDSNGIVSLKKNFKVGSYKIISSIKDGNAKSRKTKSTLTVKSASTNDCCSFYLQLKNNESVSGFRRDSTSKAKILIKQIKFHG